MKKRQIVIYIILMLTLLCTSVYATISGNLSLTASPTTVVAGEEFNVTLNLNNFDTSSGIDSLTIYIDIDEDVLEDLTVDSIVQDSGTVTINSANVLPIYDVSSGGSSADDSITFNSNLSRSDADYLIVIDLASTITSSTDVITLTFQTQSDLSVGTYADAIEMKYKLYSSSELDSTSWTTKTLDVEIVSSSASGDNNNNNNNNNNSNNNNNNNNNNSNNNNNNNNNNSNNNTNNNANNNSNSNNNNSNNNSNSNSNNNNSNKNSSNNSNNNTSNNSSNNTVDNTTATGSLPNTGYRVIIIPIILFIVMGFAFYKKYSKYNKF